MANFIIAYKKTGGWEGGWNHVANDRGGETYKGIARNFWPKWSGWKVIDAYKKTRKLKNGDFIKDPALDKLVLDFYKKEFWDVVGGDQIEDQNTANTLYDFGVNAGYGRSIQNIQTIFGMTANGKISADLIMRINNPEKYLV